VLVVCKSGFLCCGWVGFWCGIFCGWGRVSAAVCVIVGVVWCLGFFVGVF